MTRASPGPGVAVNRGAGGRMTVIGIEPGLSGAVAILTSGGMLNVFDMPAVGIKRNGRARREIDVAGLAAILRPLRASQLMPTYAAEWRRACDDGRAEAALISLYGLTQGGGRAIGSPSTGRAPAPASEPCMAPQRHPVEDLL